MTLGQKIKIIRVEIYKWTQERLSSESGIKQSIISRIEDSKSANPTIDTITAISIALNCPVDVLCLKMTVAEFGSLTKKIYSTKTTEEKK
jgi:transcriptional regulator with XRE-family HTH domain